MLKYTFLLGIGLLGTLINTSAQTSSNDLLFDNFEFRKFINAQSNTTESQKLILQLAHSYYFLNDFENANNYFAKLDWNDDKLELVNHLFYANSLKNKNNIQAAKKEILSYLTYYPKDKDALLLKDQIENYPKLKDFIESKVLLYNFEILNSPSAQFSIISKDENLFYVSENKNISFSKSEIEFSENSEDLVYGKVARPETCIYSYNEKSVNETLVKSFEKYNIGGFCWSKSDNVWFLTLTPKASKWSKMNKYAPRIYTWKEGSNTPKKLKIKGVNGATGVGHPAVSADGKYLVYSLDKGVNGSDLYVSSKISESKWTRPTKLSTEVNTFKDEVFPIIEGDSVLYFSSDGKLGFGGLDIYKIGYKNGNVVGKAQLLSKPFNTESDDYSIYFKDKLKTQGFVVSDRENGKGDADIYFFNTITRWKLELQIQDEEGQFLTSDEIQIKVNGGVFEIKKLDNGVYEKIHLEPNSTVSLNLTYEDSLISREFNIPNTNGRDTTLILKVWHKKKLLPPNLDQEITKISENENLKSNFKPIYFEFNKFSISNDYKKQLQDLIDFVKNNPDRILIVKTLADERGDVIYNLELSTKRAKEIYTFLTSKGVKPKQIKLQSLGEAVYDEKCSPNCDESIHSKYRRADFEIR